MKTMTKTKNLLLLAAFAVFDFACSGAACSGLSGCSTDTFMGSDGGDAEGGDPGEGGADVDAADDTDASGPSDGGIGDADAEAAVVPTYRRVFISSTTVNSSFGSLAAADAVCTADAAGASLGGGGSWKAWLSTASTSAASRLEHATVPYRLVDGTEVAKNWTQLAGGTLESVLDENEHGQAVGFDEDASTNFSSGIVWTGSTNGGMAATTCADWTVSEDCNVSTTTQGIVGRDDSSTKWSSWVTSGCCTVEAHSFYCVEQYP